MKYKKRDDLKNKLSEINKVFNFNSIINIKTDKDYIQKYYYANKLAYTLFHTKNDRMYMGVSRDGKYKGDDLLEGARTVGEYIIKLNATHVLELATGRGATSSYLAEKYSNVAFDGVDLSEGQLDFAFKKAKKLKNYHPVKGDFHNLSKFKDNRYDIIFEIEALCYSMSKNIVLEQVKNKLKKGGVFILLDGYLAKKRAALNNDELLAEQLTEKSMAVDEFEYYGDFKKTAKNIGFSIIHDENVSKFILPTLRRFEKKANYFFKYKLIAILFKKFFKKEFILNAIAGELMPNLFLNGVNCYYITVLKKV